MSDFKMNLQLFAEGGDGGAPAGGESAAAESTGVQPSPSAPRRAKKVNPLANVRYGVQQEEAPAEQASAEPNPEKGRQSFEDLIKGEYKQDFDDRVQSIIRDRFKKNADNEDRLNSMNPLLEMLGKKYNVDSTDIEKLTAVISDDDSLYEDEAIERGMSVDTLKQIKKLERETEQLRQREQMSQQQMMVRDHLNKLGQQAEAAKQLYPNLNLNEELKNPMFARLTSPNVGVDVRTAFEVVHRDELRGAEMQFAAQKSAEKLAASVRSNAMRPAEGAMNGNQTANTVKTDPRTLTKADREEIRRRVQRGEKIAF